jgi:uncharacterized membrane protein YvlD (DUF360 family)
MTAGAVQMPLLLKSLGYFVSIISVILLGTVAWKSASQDSTLLACLLGGMITSVLGMGLRWTSFYVKDKRDGG